MYMWNIKIVIPLLLVQVPRRRWFVFGIINGTDPYLEYYESEDLIFTNNPINMFFLDKCRKVEKHAEKGRHQNVVSVIMRDRELDLVAQSR